MNSFINLCLIGKGNVGTCFLQLLVNKKKQLEHKFGMHFKLVAIFEYDGALINENGLNLQKILKNADSFRKLEDWKADIKALDYLSKLNIDVCIETTPTNPDTGEPALSHILESLRNGFDVISSNKGPFYLQYKKIHQLAEQNNCHVKYDATVASCVPALAIKDDLIGNEIVAIKAILNGTSNYILSRMTSEGVNFSLALKEAQELGYAEADPTLDIEGYDAAGKLVILANRLLDLSLTIKDVEIRGITKITPQAIRLAKSDGYIIKHLAICKNNTLIVEPRLIEKNSNLDIGGTLNAIEIQTKYAGPIILMGRGAGGSEAAAAILNDLLSIQQLRK
jgi:homoserine dehydrogenase